jgi:lipopolysaccharide export LptBFGC system permease protein LptF
VEYSACAPLAFSACFSSLYFGLLHAKFDTKLSRLVGAIGFGFFSFRLYRSSRGAFRSARIPNYIGYASAKFAFVALATFGFQPSATA